MRGGAMLSNRATYRLHAGQFAPHAGADETIRYRRQQPDSRTTRSPPELDTPFVSTPLTRAPADWASTSEAIEPSERPPGDSFDLDSLPAKPIVPEGAACAPPNVCTVEKDDNAYYHVQYMRSGEAYWIDPHSLGVPVQVHDALADAHRLAVYVRLSFDFFYYGHVMNSIIVTTGGFLYMNEFSHSFLTASQYVAPLMANFDTSMGSNQSHVIIADNGTVCVVQWNRVIISDHVSHGEYTFQVQLYKSSGKIVFAYLEVPQEVRSVSTENHPVRVGIADAFYWDSISTRTIYEYDQLHVDLDMIVSRSVVVFHHKKSCQFLKSCKSCLSEHVPHFNCSWCSRLSRCSSTVDRGRQQWFQAGCTTDKKTPTAETCNASAVDGNMTGDVFNSVAEHIRRNMLGSLVTVVSTIALVSSCACFSWLCYAYTHPGSRAGQWLIENRPSRLLQALREWRNSRNVDNDSCTVEIRPLPSESTISYAY